MKEKKANAIKNNRIVSITELNQILNEKKPQNEIVEIDFLNIIEKIDIVFIAGLFLLRKKKRVKFNIRAVISSEKRKYEVRQYIRQYEKLFNVEWRDVFTDINFLNVKLSEGDIENQLIDKFDFQASKSFAPIILVNNYYFDTIFNTSLSELTGVVSVLGFKYIPKSNQGSNEKEKQYLESADSIFKKLVDHPLIIAFVFSILYSKINPFVSSKRKGIKDPIERTKELWRFTLEFVVGLKELAKNIVEHSSTGEGIITIRAYDKDEENSIDGKVLEAYIFDFGEKGIIQKLKDETILKKDTNKIYKEDLVILNDSFSLVNFIKPSKNKQLNQQLYRDIAHYGLTKFYKLIERNEGLVISSTNNDKNERDVYSNHHSISNPIQFGTSYFFQLPFKPELFATIESSPNLETQQGTSQTIGGLSKLIGLKVIREISELQTGVGHVLFDFKPTIKKIQNRESESELFDSINLIKDAEVKYLAIDMKELSLSASSLLRFMAHLSSNYNQSILIYNLNFELYDEMVEDNKKFFENLLDLKDRVPYWYENKAILIFSTLKKIEFNFADILFGKDENEFNSANQIISHTFPNTVTITKGEQIHNDNIVIHKSIAPFFYQSSLLPFDLLLSNSDKFLFQSNLTTLLNAEIKI